MNPAFVTGLKAEAALLRRYHAASGDGTPAGALAAAERLVAEGAKGLVSFGLAGGLSRAVKAGSVLVPEAVLEAGTRYACDPGIMQFLGGGTGGVMLAGERIVADADEKAALYRESGALAVDLESGAVARVAAAHGLPFAVLRAVADPARRTLPPAALIPLKADGAINLGAILRAVAWRPAQIPGLIALAGDASRARQALHQQVRRLPEAVLF
jgi:adenosylhomocysteine nucleosidase